MRRCTVNGATKNSRSYSVAAVNLNATLAELSPFAGETRGRRTQGFPRRRDGEDAPLVLQSGATSPSRVSLVAICRTTTFASHAVATPG